MSQEQDQPRHERGRRHYLARRRTAAHAQAQAIDIEHPDVLEHPLVPDVEPRLIVDQPTLDAQVHAIADAPVVAYDTEFIGETSYYPHLCLIQLATADRLLLIDPFGGEEPEHHDAAPEPALDLRPVWDLLGDADVVKLVHAGAPDIEPAVRLHHVAPAALFDTQIAAGFVGHGYPVSLRQLISDLLGHELPKALTFTRWDQRPLSDVHLRYAVDDVRYLPALREMLAAKLESFGRTDWAAAEFAALANPRSHRFNAAAVVARLRQRHRLPARNAVLLRRLVSWRDRMARRRNLPPRSVLQDKVLVAIARAAPTGGEALREIDGVPRGVVQWQGRTIIHTVKRAMQSAAWSDPPRRPRPLSPTQRQRVDRLWQQLKQRCDDMQLAPGLLTSRREVAALATAAIRNHPIPADHRLLNGWRRLVVQPILDDLGIGHDGGD